MKRIAVTSSSQSRSQSIPSDGQTATSNTRQQLSSLMPAIARPGRYPAAGVLIIPECSGHMVRENRNIILSS